MPPRKGSTKKPKEPIDLDYSSSALVGSEMKLKSNSTSTTLNKAQIESMLRNPQQNFEKLQDTSKILRTLSGVYDNIIKYYTNLLTLDHMIIPTSSPLVFQDQTKINQSYIEAATLVETMRLKENLRTFINALLTYGECYYIELRDKSGFMYKEIKPKFCVPYEVVNGRIHFALDMSKMNQEDPTEYPISIQTAMDLFKKNPDNSIFVQKKYYLLGDEGVCFKFTQDGNHGIPPFVNLFSSLISLDEKRDLNNSIEKVSNSIFLHQEIPIDTKTNEPILKPDQIKLYQGAVKASLEKQKLDTVFSLINPFKASALKLNTNDSSARSMVKDALANIYDECGTSQAIFNSGDSATSLTLSTKVDSSFMEAFIPMLEAYVNSVVGSKKFKGINWCCRMLPNTIYNRDDARKTTSAEMAYGGSVFAFFSSCGYTPLQSMNIVNMENAMGIKSIITPIATSHTQSGSESESGRPSVDDMISDGETISDSTEVNLKNE